MTAQQVRQGGCPSWCVDFGDSQHLVDVAVNDIAEMHLGHSWRKEALTADSGVPVPMEPDSVTVYPSVAWDLKRGPVPLVNVSTNDCTSVTITPAEAREMAVALLEAAATAERWD